MEIADARKSTVSYTVSTCSQWHLHNTKRIDLTESTGVVLAKYPLKVKLGLLTTLECQRRVNYAYLSWWGYWGFYSSKVLTYPCWIRSLFLLGVFLGRILQDPFLIGIPLGFTKRGEQVISLYTLYMGGKQPFIRIVSLHCPLSLNVVSFMKASAFRCLVRYFLTSSSSMSTMKADECKRGHQPMSLPQSVDLFLTASISYFLPHQLPPTP